MTKLQLENSEIIVGVDFTNNNRVNEILTKENSCSFLLYPGKENFNLSIKFYQKKMFQKLLILFSVTAVRRKL